MAWWRKIELVQRHAGAFARHNTAAKMINFSNIYRQFWTGRAAVKCHPCEIIIDPINVCNLRCPLCVTGQHKNTRSQGSMKFEDFAEIIDQLDKWLYLVRFYSWGEPLLHQEIYRMVAHAQSKNIGTELSSNLHNLGPQSAEEMVESGLENLIVSLDGATASVYGKYRVGGDFELVLQNIRTLLKTRRERGRRFPLIEIQFLNMRHNEHQIEDIQKLGRELGVDRVRLVPVTLNVKDATQVSKWLPRDESLSRYDYQTWEDRVYRKRKRCEWLWRSAVFNWDGSISPCCAFEGPKTDFGNLKELSFEDIWNNPCYQSSRDVFDDRSSSDAGIKTICHRCKGKPQAFDEQQLGIY